MPTIRLTATHGTRLTDHERQAGESAAAAILGTQIASARGAFLAFSDCEDYRDCNGLAALWAEAEAAATMAACAGWSRHAEDLVLE